MFDLLLLAALIFSIPTNLFKTFLENTAYVSGLQVDYLIPKLHLSDFFLLSLFVLLICNTKNRELLLSKIKNLPHKPLLLLLGLILVLFQITIGHPIVSFLFLFRLLLLAATGTIISKNTHFLKSEVTITAIKITVIFQSLLAWYQYLNQKSFFGYYFLGETNLNSYAGIAQSSLFGMEKILPYGTTAHPNVLAGILTIFTLFLCNHFSNKPKNKHIETLIVLLATSTIFLTQSVSAIIGLALGFAILLLKNKLTFNTKKIITFFILANVVIISFFAINLNQKLENLTSISRRAYLNTAALNIVKEQPIAGVGLQNFTAYLEKYSTHQEVVRFIQPVHNILLLVFSETGFVGVLLLVFLMLPILKKNKRINHPEYIVAIVPIMVLDHYLLTIQSGLLLLSLSVWLKD